MPQPANPPEEPYFLLGDRLHQAWKLYPDTLDSFATTVILTKSEPSGFQILGKTTEDGLWSTVAAPSRLYSTPSKELPLAGMRVSVKDNFCLKGIKTTQSNRAFVDTYGPETETAAYLKKLINLGAVIVGKTKLCAFASSEEATDQWIDFHPPFNPRADGYQSPSGSTSGGATSLAGYQWLDFSIGTDTSGSVRWPAAWNGLFGLRVTTNATSLDGVYAACRKMDTVGLLSRDLSSLHDFAQHTIEKTSGDIKTFPKRLLYSTDFFPHSNKIQQTIVEEYVTVLENFLDVKRIEFIIADRWAQCPPAEAEGKPLKEFLNKTAFNPFYWDGYHEFDQFREDHETKFGKKVYVGPYMRWKWEMGASVTEDEVKQSLGEWAVYEQWFHDTIFQEDPECGSTAVMVLPCGTSAPKYRDDPNSPPGIVPAFSPNYIASMIGLPQLVLPIGQFPYESRVSGRVEYLPAVGTLVGAKGSDLMLVNLAKAALEDAKWPTEVLTGRFTFKPGEGSRNVAHLDNTGPSHL
ncbi:putative amidase [Cadophora sp. DSE1049]|nr:putative amidase [Cadophora sp. DSE1049]